MFNQTYVINCEDTSGRYYKPIKIKGTKEEVITYAENLMFRRPLFTRAFIYRLADWEDFLEDEDSLPCATIQKIKQKQ